MSLPHDGDDVGHHTVNGQGRSAPRVADFVASQSAFHQHRHRTTPIAHLLSFLYCMIDATFMHTMSRIGHAIITRLVFGSWSET